MSGSEAEVVTVGRRSPARMQLAKVRRLRLPSLELAHQVPGCGKLEVVPAPSLPPAVSAALDRFRAVVASKFGHRLREVVLFGSYARGDAHAESDVDVLVVVDGLAERERRDVMDAAYDAAAAAEDVEDWVCINPIPYSVDQVADLRSRERRLIRDIDAEGVRL